MNPFTRTPSWLTEHWRGAALIACAVGAIAVLRWNYDKDPERRARMQEKDVHSLAERISKYARDMQEKYPTGSVVVSEHDLADAMHRPPERIARALGLLHSQQKVERAPLSGYWKLKRLTKGHLRAIAPQMRQDQNCAVQRGSEEHRGDAP